MKKAGDVDNSNSEQKTMKPVNRRGFLTTLAAGAGLVPLAVVSRRLAAGSQAAASSACYTPTSVLTPSDFSYVGMFKMPSASPNPLSFSQGLITGRRAGGATTILITGPAQGSGTRRTKRRRVERP